MTGSHVWVRVTVTFYSAACTPTRGRFPALRLPQSDCARLQQSLRFGTSLSVSPVWWQEQTNGAFQNQPPPTQQELGFPRPSSPLGSYPCASPEPPALSLTVLSLASAFSLAALSGAWRGWVRGQSQALLGSPSRLP